MEPCESNCEYGDGVDALTYDGSKCGCVKCPNFPVCRVWAPPWVFGCNRGLCINCASWGPGRLEFKSLADCPICLEHKPSVKHPACEHTLCVDCLREQMYPSDAPSLPSRPYGFVTDCMCCWCNGTDKRWDYCDDAHQIWKIEHPDQYEAWSAADNAQREAYDAAIDERVDWRACCLCRKTI